MRIQTIFVFTALIVAMAIAPGFPVLAADAPEVTIQNYVRAETDLQMRNYVENIDAFGKFAHVREAHDVTNRDTIRPNRDTLYSWSVTLYDVDNGFFIPNDRKKYSVGANAGMQLDDDGGIEIYIAAEKPPGVPEENWLPITREDLEFGPIMRLYEPDLERFGTWTAPKAEEL